MSSEDAEEVQARTYSNPSFLKSSEDARKCLYSLGSSGYALTQTRLTVLALPSLLLLRLQKELCSGPGNGCRCLFRTDDPHLILPSGCDPQVPGYFFLGTSGGCSTSVDSTDRTEQHLIWGDLGMLEDHGVWKVYKW